MTTPTPAIHFGPDANKLAVKVPIWLWIDAPPPMSLNVAIPGLSVTVTAAMKTTTWSMGEPINPAQPAIQFSPFTCQGPGSPAPTNPSITTKPPCGYTYTWKSLPDRTNGTSTWEVTATTNWDVTWTASNGTNGKLEKPLTPRTTTHITIGEWRSTLINGSGK